MYRPRSQFRRARAARPGQRGTALALSLISVMIIASLGAGLVSLQTAMDKRQNFSIDRRRALYLAEAGVAEAALAVTLGKSGVIASEDVPAAFGQGVYWVEADELPDDRVLLRCTARIASAEFVIQSMVLPSVNPVTRLGLFGTDGVTLGWGTIVDGYHSGQGDFASQVDAALPTMSTGRLGLVGSDADIVLSDFVEPAPPATGGSVAPAPNWGRLAGAAPEPPPPSGATPPPPPPPPPTFVYGELRPGDNGLVRSSGLPVIVGDIRPYDEPPFLPEVTLPTPEEVISSDVEVAASQTGVGVTMTTQIRGVLSVASGAILTIEGPKVIRCNTLVVNRGATLVLDDENGPIHVYAENGIDFRKGSTLLSPAPEPEARGTYIFVPGAAEARDRVALDATGTFHGAIYAPDDIVRLPAGLRWFGSLAARVVITEQGAHFTLDRRLGIGGDGFPALPRQLSWQVVPLGKQIARSLNVNPMLALALRGVTPVPSSTASIETDIEIQYMDQSQQPASYSGSFAGFDPTQAKRIIGARWEDPRDGSMGGWATPAGSESTGAVEDMRDLLRTLRATLLVAVPGTDVTALSDSETVTGVALATSPADVPTAPTAVKRAVQRVDTTQPAQDPDPLDRAVRASLAARDYANTALALQMDALALVTGPLSAGAQAASLTLVTAGFSAVTAADGSGGSARTASLTTGQAQIDAADEAERLASEALRFSQEAAAAFALFSTLV